MHIVDGALSPLVLTAGTVLTVGGVAVGLRQLEVERIPQTAMLSAVFFIASLIHVPIGPASIHLVLNGLMGVVLGWAAFPALLIALLLQAAFFGFGGLSVLGINTFNMALPAVLCFYLCARGAGMSRFNNGFIWGFLAGALGVLLASVLVALSLATGGQAFIPAAQLVIATNVPVMFIDGLVTGAAVVLMRKVKPEILQTPLPAQPHA